MKIHGAVVASLLRIAGIAILLMMPGLAGALEPRSLNLPRDSCPPLLMEGECREYLAQMQAATNASQRESVQKRYAPLLQERARLCHTASGDSCVEVIISPQMFSLPIQGKRIPL